MPTVSVIMGVYNSADTLERCVNSLLEQTYTDWELILCDDGSTDDTYEIAKSISDKHSNITLLKNTSNKGLAYSLNKCLNVAQGKYIARMDADDISIPERFQKQVEFLENHPEYSVVGSSVILYDENGDMAVRKAIEYPDKYSLLKSVPFMHPTIMMRKEVYDILNGYTVSKRTIRGQDMDLWFRFFAKGFKGYNIQTPLLKYQESLSDYKKRSFKVRWNGVKTRFIGYRKLNYPLRYYIYLLKPVIAGLIPHRIMYFYHKKVKGKQL